MRKPPPVGSPSKVISLKPPGTPSCDPEAESLERFASAPGKIVNALSRHGISHTIWGAQELLMRIGAEIEAAVDARHLGSKMNCERLLNLIEAYHMVIAHQGQIGNPTLPLDHTLENLEALAFRIRKTRAVDSREKPGRGKNALGGVRRRAIMGVLAHLRSNFTRLSSRDRQGVLTAIVEAVGEFPFDKLPSAAALKELDKKSKRYDR